jgi:hypothetical protein
MGQSAQQTQQKKSIAQNNQYMTQAGNNANSLYGIDVGQLQKILANPGYTTGQINDMNRQALGGIGASYGSAAQAAKNSAAATNNAAGLTGSLDKLAQSKAQTVAQTEAGLGLAQANDAQQQQMSALGMIGNLYGINTDLLKSTLSNNAQTAQRYSGGNLANIFGGIAGMAGGLGTAGAQAMRTWGGGGGSPSGPITLGAG